MKIGIIVRRLNVQGGTQRQAVFLARILKNRGHDVVLYTFLPPGQKAYQELLAGLRVVALGRYPRSRNAVWDFFSEHRASRALARLIDQDTDLLNPHDQVAYQAAYYFKKNVRDVPSVWMMNDLPIKSFSAEREKEVGGARPRSLIKNFIWRLLDAYEIATCIRAQNAIAVLDERDRRRVKECFDKDASVVRSGIDVAEFPFRIREDLDAHGEIRILAVGILFPHRRFEDLLKAIALLRDRGYRILCTIVGAYDQRDAYYKKLVQVVADLRLQDAISFAGRVSEEELRRRYNEADIFVFPSHLQSWGLAVFEAMASGLPVIVSQSAGAAEVLEHGENALIVPPKSPATIADAIARLADDAALRRRLSEQGRKFIEANLSWERYADIMEKIFIRAVSA